MPDTFNKVMLVILAIGVALLLLYGVSKLGNGN